MSIPAALPPRCVCPHMRSFLSYAAALLIVTPIAHPYHATKPSIAAIQYALPFDLQPNPQSISCPSLELCISAVVLLPMSGLPAVTKNTSIFAIRLVLFLFYLFVS